MGCAECTLGAYANAIEMAFAANLLFSVWGAVYKLLLDRRKDLTKTADKLTGINYFQEELSISLLKFIIGFTNKGQSFFWWNGLAFCLPSALFLYILSWHASPNTSVCNGWWWLLLMFAAYAGPASMFLMTCVGTCGNKLASFLTDKLQEQLERKQAQSLAVQDNVEQRIDELLAELHELASANRSPPEAPPML